AERARLCRHSIRKWETSSEAVTDQATRAGRPDTFLLRMRPPRRLCHQLQLLVHHQRSELRSKPLDEILVREHGRPVRAPGAVILEFPDVHELIDHPRVSDEISDEVLVVATLLQRRKPEL